MDYITLEETKEMLGRVLAPYKDSGVVNDAHLTLVVESAEGMVNAAIASRYTIPVTSAQAINYLRSLVVPIIRYKTFTQFADQEDFPEGVMLEYKSVMKELDKLATRVTSLPNVDDKTTGRAAYISTYKPSSRIEDY